MIFNDHGYYKGVNLGYIYKYIKTFSLFYNVYEKESVHHSEGVVAPSIASRGNSAGETYVNIHTRSERMEEKNFDF